MVFGNTDSVVLESIHFTSGNTSDEDLLPGGVKLYSSSLKDFKKSSPLGSPTDFESGVASFTGLNHTLPAGHSYLWLTYDVDPGATHEDIKAMKAAKLEEWGIDAPLWSGPHYGEQTGSYGRQARGGQGNGGKGLSLRGQGYNGQCQRTG